MTWLDYTVIAVYFAFMLALGPIYKSFSRTASDYFRGGGGMLWWMVGVSGFLISFSAWSFTGGAGRAYETGTYLLVLSAANFVATLITYFYTAAKFRQMRVVTAIEAVFKRFGRENEQFFLWIPLVFNFLFGGISLYTIALFMSCVFHVQIFWTILVIGLTVTFLSMHGGAWSVVASDFLQGMTVLVITILMTVLTLAHPAIGGFSGLLEKLPVKHFDWSMVESPSIIVLFVITLFINQTIQMNSLLGGAIKYVFVKNGRDAQKACLISVIGSILMPFVWLIPPMAATIIHPNLAAEYPMLATPSEASYVAMAFTLLPAGMMGLLVSGIFASTMGGMEAGLNRNAGFLVRNFYLPLINPHASESRQLRIGRVLTVINGLIIIGFGMFFSTLKSMPLFNLILLAAACTGLPLCIPMFLGIFIKKTPHWAAWSTALVGFIVAVFMQLWGVALVTAYWPEPLTNSGSKDLNVAATTAVITVFCVAWFIFSMNFYKQVKPAIKTQLDHFFIEMDTPIDMTQEHNDTYDNDVRQYTVLGKVSAAYGTLIMLLALVPNTWIGHISFVCCGGFIAGIGFFLCHLGNRQKNKLESPGFVPQSVTNSLSEVKIEAVASK